MRRALAAGMQVLDGQRRSGIARDPAALGEKTEPLTSHHSGAGIRPVLDREKTVAMLLGIGA
jgi:hypothetical protein